MSVTASQPDKPEQTFYYPETVPSGEVVKDSTGTVGVELSPEENQEMVSAVDYAKSHKPYLSEIELSFNFKEGFKFRIKREPSKIIYYRSHRNQVNGESS